MSYKLDAEQRYSSQAMELNRTEGACPRCFDADGELVPCDPVGDTQTQECRDGCGWSNKQYHSEDEKDVNMTDKLKMEDLQMKSRPKKGTMVYILVDDSCSEWIWDGERHDLLMFSNGHVFATRELRDKALALRKEGK